MIDISPIWTNISLFIWGFRLFVVPLSYQFTIKNKDTMSDKNKKLQELTQKFIQDFITASGESSTYAINMILPEIIAPLLPKYDEEYSIVLPMASFDAQIMKESIKERAKGWTKRVLKIMQKVEVKGKLDFDRYRFENFTSGFVDKERCEITNYEKFEFKFVKRPHVVKTFDIISTTNNFKGTVSMVFESDPELYPVREVSLICGNREIFSWSICEENGEKVSDGIDVDYIKNLNSFFLYTNFEEI